MPVLVNTQTGLAENLTDSQAHAAVQAGTHEVPIIDREGNMGSSPWEDARGMLAEGTHVRPNKDQLQSLLDYAKYSSTLEQLKTFGEGVAEAATFGASTGLEVAAGADPRDIRGRRTVNPNVHMAGQVASLIGQMAIPGEAAAGAMKMLGEGAETAILGSRAAETGGQALKMGMGEAATRGAVRLATEGGMFQGGDELSKKFEQDPDQTAQSAALNIGLAALATPILGGGIEGAGKLWEATAGKKLAPIMQAARERLASGAGETQPVSEELMSRYPHVRAVLGDAPTAEEAHQFLLNSPSSSGNKYREDIKMFRQGATDEALGKMGYTADEIPMLREQSKYSAGQEIGDKLIKDTKSRYEPIKERYDSTTEKYKATPVTVEDLTDIGSKVAQIADEVGAAESPSSTNAKLLKTVQEELPNIKTVEGIRKYRIAFNDTAVKNEAWGIRRKVLTALDDAKDRIVTEALGEKEGAEALAQHQAATSGYRNLMEHIEDLNDRLRVGKFNGPESFMKNLSEMRPEQILDRLNPKNDAGLISLLREKMPDIAEDVRKYQLEKFIKGSVKGDEFNLNTFINKIDHPDVSPEHREFLMGDSYKSVKDIKNMLNELPYTDNPSGSGKAITRGMSKLLWHMGAGSLLLHGNPILAGLAELTGGMFTRELPDAARVAWLRFLGGAGDKVVDPAAFKATLQLAHNAAKGLEKINKAVDTIVPGLGNITVNEITERDIKKLEKLSDTYQNSPGDFMKSEDKLGVYEPGHSMANTMLLARSAQAIAAAKPKTKGTGILDSEITPSNAELAHYHSVLQTVQNPLSIMKHMGDGTLTPDRLNVFKSVNPNLYQHINDKITEKILDMNTKGQKIPYKNRMSISMFMGQPLDSTMTPQAIAMNQPKPEQKQQQQAENQLGVGSKKSLSKMPGIYQTGSQGREQQKAMVK